MLLGTGLLLALALGVAACDSSGPTFPEAEDIFFQGTLEALEASQIHFFSLTESGSVRIGVEQLAANDPESGLALTDLTLGVSIGRPGAEEGSCSLTLTRALAEGGTFSLYLNAVEYCLQVARTFTAPSEASVDYTVSIEPAF